MIGHDRKEELVALVEQKLSALMREMEGADWKADDVAIEIDAFTKREWFRKSCSLQEARDALPSQISDGNEG